MGFYGGFNDLLIVYSRVFSVISIMFPGFELKENWLRDMMGKKNFMIKRCVESNGLSLGELEKKLKKIHV